MKYLVRIEEQLARHIIVDAESETEAKNIAQDAHVYGKVVLDYDDLDGSEVTCVREANDVDCSFYEELEVEE